jgi:hypothetical protein
MLAEFYHLRRTAIKDVCAYLGFLAGFIGAAPFAWSLLGDQLASGAFVKGLWYFFGIVVAAGIFTGIIGLGFGVVAGILWEHFHRYRRASKAIPTEAAPVAASNPVESENLEGPKLRLVREDDPPGAAAKAMLIAFLIALPAAGYAQSIESVIGTWRGTSTCLVKPSACHDEVNVYYITRLAADTSKLTIDATKIVNGVEEQMGILGPCTYAVKTHSLVCAMPPGARPGEWRFIVTGNSLDGGLYTPGNVKFRDVHLRRAPH